MHMKDWYGAEQTRDSHPRHPSRVFLAASKLWTLRDTGISHCCSCEWQLASIKSKPHNLQIISLYICAQMVVLELLPTCQKFIPTRHELQLLLNPHDAFSHDLEMGPLCSSAPASSCHFKICCLLTLWPPQVWVRQCEPGGWQVPLNHVLPMHCSTDEIEDKVNIRLPTASVSWVKRLKKGTVLCDLQTRNSRKDVI